MIHKKHIVNILILYLMIMCLGLSIGYGNKAKSGRHVANIYMDNDSITAEAVNSMHIAEEKEDIKLSFTGWSQIDKATIEYPYLNKKVTADIIKVSGDSSLVVNGPILFLDNKKGCLIDEETSYKLFGSKEVIGQIINYEGRELEVVGIHSGMDNTIVMQTENKSSEKIDAIAVEIVDTVTKSVKTFSDRYNINSEAIDNRSYYNIANIFIMSLQLIIFIILLVTFVKEIVKVKRKPILCGIYVIVTMVLIAIFIKILGIEIKIPYDLIPNKWSDFDYWGKLLDTYKEKIETLMYMKKYNTDIMFIQSTIKSIVFSILAIILFFKFKEKVKVNNIKEITILVSSMLIISFIVILIIRFKYNLEITGLVIWLLLPYYYVARYISANKFQKI